MTCTAVVYLLISIPIKGVVSILVVFMYWNALASEGNRMRNF
jgi:hypothetical protein